MRIVTFALACALASLSLPAFAQLGSGEKPVNLRGTIDKLAGDTLIVNTREGSKASVKLDPKVAVSYPEKKSLTDIKTGDFIACTSIKGADGKLHALEVHLFPSGRHPREVQRPYDLAPGSLMTNATVGQVSATSQGGKTLTVTEKGHTSVIEIGQDVPVVMAVPGDKGLLKPGAFVFVAAVEKDGSLTTSRITAEKNGVKPPM